MWYSSLIHKCILWNVLLNYLLLAYEGKKFKNKIDKAGKNIWGGQYFLLSFTAY